MQAGQPPLVALAVAGNVHGVALLQLRDLLLDLVPPARSARRQLSAQAMQPPAWPNCQRCLIGTLGQVDLQRRLQH